MVQHFPSCLTEYWTMGLTANAAGLLIMAQNLASLNRPSRREFLSIRTVFDEEAPLCEVESYIYCEEDIVTLKPSREDTWLDASLEKMLEKLSCRFIRVSIWRVQFVRTIARANEPFIAVSLLPSSQSPYCDHQTLDTDSC
jgi:hypothetical protein